MGSIHFYYFLKGCKDMGSPFFREKDLQGFANHSNNGYILSLT